MKQPAMDMQMLQRLQDSGFTKPQAIVLMDLHKERERQLQNVADKRDILLIQKDIEYLRADTKKDINNLSEKIEQLRADTKKDIEQLRADTKKDINNLSEKIEQLRADTKKDIEQLRADTKKDINNLSEKIEQLRADTKKDIEMLKSSLTNRMLVIMITMTTLAISALGLLMKFLLEGLNI